MKLRLIISTHSLLHGIYPANLAGNLPYFLFDRFVCWQVSQFLPYFVLLLLCWASTNFCGLLPMFYLFLDKGDTYGANIIRNFGLLTE